MKPTPQNRNGTGDLNVEGTITLKVIAIFPISMYSPTNLIYFGSISCQVDTCMSLFNKKNETFMSLFGKKNEIPLSI